MTSEKIQKVLANAGIASRRKIETMIQEGRITVDGNIAKIGDRITKKARVTLDGKPVEAVAGAIMMVSAHFARLICIIGSSIDENKSS